MLVLETLQFPREVDEVEFFGIRGRPETAHECENWSPEMPIVIASIEQSLN